MRGDRLDSGRISLTTLGGILNENQTHYYDAPLVRNMCTAGVILGIGSIAFCWIPIIAPFAGLIAIVLGFIGREKVVRAGRTDYLNASHTAIITGIIGLIIGVVFLALSFGFGPGTHT
jgi:hypothetical protein